MSQYQSSPEHNRIPLRKGHRMHEIFVPVALACITFPLAAILVTYTKIQIMYATMLAVLFYLSMLSVWGAIVRRNITSTHKSIFDALTDSELGGVMSSLRAPAFLLDDRDRILWTSDSAAKAIGQDSVTLFASFSDLFEVTASEDKEKSFLTVKEHLYEAESIPFTIKKSECRLVILHDCTDREYWKNRYSNERDCILYVAIDNVDETLQSVHEDFHSKALDVERILAAWVDEMDGVMRSYDRNRYVIFMDRYHVSVCKKNRFDILDRVRTVHVGDGSPITVSIGVADLEGSLEERNRAAQSALDMSLLRGGDQAAYKTEDGVDFYGGKTKGGYKRTNIKARVVANQLSALMVRADHVLIMGHRFGDFDSFGAAIGIARFARHCGAEAHIVINLRDKNLQPCFERMASSDEYRGIFIDGSDALDIADKNALLVMVDVNNFDNVESTETARRARKIVVIDHHRKTAEFDESVLIEYIEPSASSASELIGEMLQQHLPAGTIGTLEAEFLFTGILLDTKQFTRNTGTRTFGVASFLRGEGASPQAANDLFKSDVDDLVKESRFHANTLLYKNRIAISSCEGETDASYRVIAAKVADKLLSVRDVEAAFALALIGNSIHISARSNGKINVQLILEALNGGGHYDVAGAQVSGKSMQEVVSILRASIDRSLSGEQA